jgi:hypothetical protein
VLVPSSELGQQAVAGAVPGRGRPGRNGQADADARCRGGGEVGQQRGQVHRLAARRELVRVGPGQHQQPGDELLQALALPHGPARDLRPRRVVRVGQAHLQPGPDRGQRAAQLVRGVGRETPLPGRGA